jgi:hypothetical protein
MNKRELITLLRAMPEALVTEAPPPKPPVTTPPPGHAAHVVPSRYGGLEMCCLAHAEAFANNVRRQSRTPGPMDHLSPGQRQFIQERLGHRRVPSPRR